GTGRARCLCVRRARGGCPGGVGGGTAPAADVHRGGGGGGGPHRRAARSRRGRESLRAATAFARCHVGAGGSRAAGLEPQGGAPRDRGDRPACGGGGGPRRNDLQSRVASVARPPESTRDRLANRA